MEKWLVIIIMCTIPKIEIELKSSYQTSSNQRLGSAYCEGKQIENYGLMCIL